jgi:hypothetical protein
MRSTGLPTIRGIWKETWCRACSWSPIEGASMRTGIKFAAFGVGFLRRNYAARIGDPEFERLVRAHLENSPEFRCLCNQQPADRYSPLAPSQVRLRVPGFGILTSVSTRLFQVRLDCLWCCWPLVMQEALPRWLRWLKWPRDSQKSHAPLSSRRSGR